VPRRAVCANTLAFGDKESARKLVVCSHWKKQRKMASIRIQTGMTRQVTV
tara:strand:- start:485 stop:634 length:150 start_codon:yes stop_codon:yes gene_type:complete